MKLTCLVKHCSTRVMQWNLSCLSFPLQTLAGQMCSGKSTRLPQQIGRLCGGCMREKRKEKPSPRQRCWGWVVPMVKKLASSLSCVQLYSPEQVPSVEVLLHPALSLEALISSVVRSTFHQLWLVQQLQKFLDWDNVTTVVQTFVTSRLDNCNVGLPLILVQELQLVQRAPAQLLTGVRCYQDITPWSETCAICWLVTEPNSRCCY